MERITSLRSSERLVLSSIRQLLAAARKVTAQEPRSTAEGIELLRNLRKAIYEDLNQIQHEAMVLQAAKWIERNDLRGLNVEWYWNPRQTGTAEEPDLLARVRGRIRVSVEATASENPKGTIAKTMDKTLEKLSKMHGKKVYFVRTEAMRERAQRKVNEFGYRIDIRCI